MLNENRFDPNASKYASDYAGFGLVISRWESLRLVFNVVLVVLCLGYTVFLNPAHLTEFEFWKNLLLGALLANVLFMTGPALDGYLTWFGVWTAPIAMFLFLAGTTLTTILALGWIGRY